MRKVPLSLTLLTVSLFLSSAIKAQQVLFTTFETGMGFYPIDGYLFSSNAAVAAPFKPMGTTLTGKFILRQIDVAVGPYSSLTPFTIEIAADASGSPGTILESWTVSSPSSGIDTVKDSLHLELQAGAQYWLILTCSVASDAWFLGFVDVEHMVQVNTGSGWTTYTKAGLAGDTPIELPAFDVLGDGIGLAPPPVGGGLGQLIRLTVVAGPVTPPLGGPVELRLNFVDMNGNAVGPSSTVALGPGQMASLDLNASSFIGALGQRIEVVPVVTQLPSATGAPPGAVQVQASVEVIDFFTGFGTVFTPAPAFPPGPADAAGLVPQGVAAGQTMRLNVLALPPNPCDAILSFADQNGNPVGPNQQVSLNPGTGASLDLDANTLGLRLAQRAEIQPMVVPTAEAPAAAQISSVCQASVEVFTRATGRTSTYQTATAQLPAVQ